MSESWCRCFACGYKWLNKHMYNSQIICEYVCTPSIALAQNFHPSIQELHPTIKSQLVQRVVCHVKMFLIGYPWQEARGEKLRLVNLVSFR